MCSEMAVLSSTARRWNSSPSASTSFSDRERMRSSRRLGLVTGAVCDFLLLALLAFHTEYCVGLPTLRAGKFDSRESAVYRLP
jgi:hypothetical protein